MAGPHGRPRFRKDLETFPLFFSPRRRCLSEGDKASGVRTRSASIIGTQQERNKSRLSAEISNCYF